MVNITAAQDQDSPLQLQQHNADVAEKTPQEIIAWTLSKAQRPLVATNFRPGVIALLHMVVKANPDLPVLWVDTGYNSVATYRYVEQVRRLLNLNLHVYAPKVTSARRYAVLEGIPSPDAPGYGEFVHEVKLEPFLRGMRALAPDYWLTGIRADQTDYRKSLSIVSIGAANSLRVAPLLAQSQAYVDRYMVDHRLPDNPQYVDPTKPSAHAECGLQRLTGC